MRLSLSIERFLLVAGACGIFALGCQPAVEVDAVVSAKSCTDGAHTMIFELNSNSAIHNFYFLGGSSNVLGIPFVYPKSSQNTGDWFVVTDIDNVAKNEKVTVKFQTHADVTNPINVWLAGVSFFKAGSNPTPTVPDCAPTVSPTFTITYIQPPPGSAEKAPASLSLEVSDPNPLPMSIVQLDLVHVPSVLDPALLDADNPVLNALAWQPAFPGGVVLDPASGPMSTSLPDGPSGGAVLCRFTSIYDGDEVDGILQINLSTPLGTRISTWGGVKALFRD